MNAKTKFTLIELLVSIAIISILASVLMPALKQTYERSRRLADINNLKQIGAAMTMYTHDSRWKGFFPANTNAVPIQAGSLYLLSNDLKNEKILINPSSTQKASTTWSEDMSCNYVYIAGLSSFSSTTTTHGTEPDSGLICDSLYVHADYGNILYVDNHVEGRNAIDWYADKYVKNEALSNATTR
jgi:prepilin-type N-terminal cleavage/methylation domain-containing protein/prepilin-type processing-associated H-X9-DG protein